MTISVKRMMIILCIFYALIYFANSMIAKAIDRRIDNKKSLISTEQSDKVQSATLNKKVRDNRKTDMTADERYALAKKNLDLAEIKRNYGISTVPRRHGPDSAEAWQEHVNKNIVTPEFINKPQTQKLLSTIQTDEEKYKRQMDHLQKNIDDLKSKLAEDPYNKTNKLLLQNMYRLQAVSKALENTVVIKQSASAPDMNPSNSNL